MITPISLYFSRGFCLPPKPCGKAKEIIVRCPAIIILASCFSVKNISMGIAVIAGHSAFTRRIKL